MSAASEPPPNPIEPDGTVNVPAFRLPPSICLSEEARKHHAALTEGAAWQNRNIIV
jgi:hypothetical protein